MLTSYYVGYKMNTLITKNTSLLAYWPYLPAYGEHTYIKEKTGRSQCTGAAVVSSEEDSIPPIAIQHAGYYYSPLKLAS